VSTVEPGTAEVAPGIRRVLAPNPGHMTLDGTNTYVVAADGGGVVIDPGPLHEEHLATVASLGPVRAVVLTHRHPDHAEGADRFAALTGCTTVLDRAELPEDGAELGVGGLRVFHTPGHTADSICLVRDDVLFTGDTILGRGTTVVAYPDGNLTDYLRSLETLQTLGDLTVLLPSARTVATAYLEHREARLAAVRAALDAGDTTPQQVVERVYADVDPVLWPAAELSVRAQLAHLEHGP
jgi:glyoxylase-like metal-dependent hydrolase (beta-lactamase superfamily II)